MLDINTISSLALFSGTPAFKQVRSTSNLVKPEFDQFLYYSRMSYENNFHGDGLIKLLEERLSDFHKTKYCVAVSSGFWGLVLAMKCLALPQKNEVIMPSFTYRRMADLAAWAGLIPHFCDVDPKTLAISAETASSCINKNSALILGVHPIINCCDVAGLVNLAASHQLPLLFDSVESVFETYLGQKIGSFGDAECFSLHASKLINGFEGGYITTSDPTLASRLIMMRDYGFNEDGKIKEFGINARLNEIHAAMSLATLDELEKQVKHNRTIYMTYRKKLENVPELRLLSFDEKEQCSYKNIIIELLDRWPLTRADTLTLLHQENILARAYYSPPLHKKEYSYPVISSRLLNTELLCDRFMLLPCGYFVSESDVELIVNLLATIKTQEIVIKQRLHHVS